MYPPGGPVPDRGGRTIGWRCSTKVSRRLPICWPGPSGRTRPRLRAAHYVRPLYVLVAAFLVASDPDIDVDLLDERDLLRRLLDEHESHYWSRWAARKGLALDRADQRVAVALATLLGAANEDEALAVAGLVPHVAESAAERLAIARWLADLYPPSPGSAALAFGALEPDRLGEVLVADILRERPELLPQAVDCATDGPAARLFTVATRVALDDEALRGVLREVLDIRLGDLMGRGFVQSTEPLVRGPLRHGSQPPHRRRPGRGRSFSRSGSRCGCARSRPMSPGIATEGLRARAAARNNVGPNWPASSPIWPSAWQRRAAARRRWARPRRRWRCTERRPGPTRPPTPPSWPWRSTTWPTAWPRRAQPPRTRSARPRRRGSCTGSR